MNQIIVFEGLDGCGKSTQVEMFLNNLKEQHINFRYLKFPNYNSPTSSTVKMYLNGEMGKQAEDINPFQSSIPFSVDRLASYLADWKSDYDSGKLLILDRYSYSNAIYQGAKCKKDELNSFLDWFEDFEFNKLKLPKPDVTIFFSMPIDISQRLMSERYVECGGSKDIHENDVKYLEKCNNVAKFISQKNNWEVIDVWNKNGNNLYSKEEISNRVWNIFIKNFDYNGEAIS